MSDTIESLELKIQSNSTEAINGLNKLTNSLAKLQQISGTFNAKGLAPKMKELANSLKPLSSIEKSGGLTSTVNALKKLPTIIKGIDDMGSVAPKMQELSEALKPITTIGKSGGLNSTLNTLKKFPKVMTELDKIDMSAVATKMKELATAMKPLADEMQKVADGFSAFPSKIQKLLNATNEIPKVNQKASVSFTDLYHKLKTVANGFKALGEGIYSAVEKSMDYTENLNLFSVSMGEYADASLGYANAVRDAMGIDPSEWVRAQGIFMTMATGFGVAGERASVMSQNLTQLGYDLASFYNMDVETAMLKLKSGLAGELEPLRAIGYDLSQAKLEATALALGIDKSVSSMTQAEKAQLRYYAIMTQVTVAQGDMARTLTDPANQMRVFKSEISMAAREIGNMFIPALNAIMPYAIAVMRVVSSLASSIAGLFGYKDEGVQDVTSTVVENTDAAQENIEGAANEAKKLKSYMLGIDELNVINPNEGSSAVEDTSDMFEFELPTYDFIEGLADSKVNIIVEEMKEWLGITDDISSWADLFDTKLGKILISVGAIGAGIAAWKVGSLISTTITTIGGAVSKIAPAFSAIGAALGAISAPVWIVIAAITALVAGLIAVYATNEDVRTSVNNAVSNIGESLVPLLTFISETVVPGLKTAWNKLIEILTPFGEWLSMAFTSIWMDMIVPALNYMATTVIPTVTNTFENLWNNVLVPLGNFLASVFAPVISMLSEVLTWLWQYVIVPLADLVGGVFAEVWVNLMKIYNEKVIPRIEKTIKVFQFLWNKVLSPIVTFLWDIFAPVFKEVFDGVGQLIEALKQWFIGLINFVTGVFTGDWKQAWQGIKDMAVGMMDALVVKIKTPINALLAYFEGFVNKVIDAWNWLKQQINSLSIEIPEWLGGGTLGFNLAMSPHVTLPRFAEGGFPEQGQMFIAREAGAEMVGSIGRRTAVANNDQIVAGIASGVAEANGEQNNLLREQNSLLRAILEKESGVYLDGKYLTNSVEKYQRERGRVLITGGVV